MDEDALDDSGLPPQAERSIAIFVDAAKSAFAGDLVSIVLFGSAAEGRMRATSDINIVVVSKRFEAAAADRLREPMTVVHSAADLNAMFLLESEVAAAMEAFAVKFADIVGRHRVLHGPDPFLNLALPRGALARRLNQVLLNLQLRLRERYVVLGLHEEQLARVIADAASPLRSSAAALLQLEGGENLEVKLTGKQALQRIAAETGDPALTAVLDSVSRAREVGRLSAGVAGPVLLALIALAGQMRERAARLG